MCANNDIRQTWPAEPQADGHPEETEDELLEEVAHLSTDLKISRLLQEVQELRFALKRAYFEGWRHGLNAVVDIHPDWGPCADTLPSDGWARSFARTRILEVEND